MRLFPPPRGPELFTYPAVNAQRYHRLSFPRTKRRFFHAVNACLVGVIVPFFLTFVGHVQLEFWVRFWPVIPSIAIVVFIINSTVSTRLGIRSQASHKFFEQSALVYCVKGRSSYSDLVPARIDRITHRDVVFGDINFDLFTVTYKDTIPGWLPDFTVTRFGIPKERDLTPLWQWFERVGLVVYSETESVMRMRT